jgi:hypothetical protein
VIGLRILGIVFGILLLSFGSSRREGRRRSERLLWAVISVGLILLSAYPAAFAPAFDLLNFRREDNRQLQGVLVVATFFLFLLYLRASSLAAKANRDVSRLVRALAQRQFRHETDPPMQRADVIVVIAAYNEEATVGEVLEQVPSEVLGLRVQPLVVIDGSRDATEEVVRRHAIPAIHAINRGQGAGLLTGYELAVELGAGIIVITDADGQTILDELPGLVQPILTDEADFVNGSRFLGLYEYDSPARAVGVKILSLFVSILTGTRVTDLASPFRAFRASAIPRFQLHQDQFQASELLIEALRKGLRYKEVPITMRRRKVGKSKKPSLPRYGLGVARAIIQTWLR